MYRLSSANKKLAQQGRKNISASRMNATTNDWNGWWSETLRRRYGEHKSAHKTVAEIAACGVRTVRLWFAGETVPQVRYLSNLLAADDELFGEYMEAIGRAPEARRMLAIKKLAEAADLLAEVRTNALAGN